jgi:putative peptide maturation system protein
MIDLKTIAVARVNGADLSLHEVLFSLKLKGQLSTLVYQAVTERLVSDAAVKEGITVDDAELQKAADAFRHGRGLNRSDATHQWLTAHKLSADDLETGLSRTILCRKLIRKVTDGQVDKYFATNTARFDRARLSRLVVAGAGKARELLSQIQDDGQDFADLARKHSIDPRAKETGGNLGLVPRKQLAPAVEAGVFAAKPGAVVGPYPVGDNFYLLKVEELVPGQLTPRVQTFIRRHLFRRWLNDRAKSAGVEIKVHQHL